MDRGLAVVAAVAIGGAVATQAPLNSELGRTVGGLGASVIALAISFAALLGLTAITGNLGGLQNAGDASWYVLIGGGLMGALYVGSIVYTVRELGAGGLTACTIAGQFAIATAIDHYGWLGVARSPVTVTKVVGLALLALGTYLVIKD